MFSTWKSFNQFLDEVLEEAGFIAGYRKQFKWATQVDADLMAEGERIVKKAHNIRANVYRYRDIRNLALKRQAESFGDAELETKYRLEAESAENKICLYGLDLLRLRVPLDDFLFEADIPERVRGAGSPRTPEEGAE